MIFEFFGIFTNHGPSADKKMQLTIDRFTSMDNRIRPDIADGYFAISAIRTWFWFDSFLDLACHSKIHTISHNLW